MFCDELQLLKKEVSKNDINIDNDEGMQSKPEIIFKKKGF